MVGSRINANEPGRAEIRPSPVYPAALKCPGSVPSFIFHAGGNPEIVPSRNPREGSQDDKWALQPPCISEMPSTKGEGLNYLNEPEPRALEADLWAEGVCTHPYLHGLEHRKLQEDLMF